MKSPTFLDHEESIKLFGQMTEIADTFGNLVASIVTQGPLSSRQKACAAVALSAADALKKLAKAEQQRHQRSARAKKEN